MIEINTISENALCCTLPPPADLAKQQQWWAFADAAEQLPDIIEVVVGMNNVTVFADYGVNLAALSGSLKHLWQHNQANDYQGQHIDIPVVYGGKLGMDLPEVAQYHGISIDEVIERHTAPIYTVFMMGFQAGFPYLGGLPEHLHTPRRAVPRAAVAAGSVGIGGAQTGIYPFASPAGWQIIGHSSVPLFQAHRQPPTLLKAGDTVRFVVQKVEK